MALSVENTVAIPVGMTISLNQLSESFKLTESSSPQPIFLGGPNVKIRIRKAKFVVTMMYGKLKQFYTEVKNHSDLTYRSIPFFVKTIREIRIELLHVSNTQGEQLSRDISDAMRFITITEREDLNGIQNYPREIPKYLGRVRDTVITYLAFANKQ